MINQKANEMNRHYITTIITPLLLIMLGLTHGGCKKLVEPSIPNDKIAVNVVYASNNTAASVLTRLLSDMETISEGTQGVPILGALAADDLKMVFAPDAFTASVYANNMTGSPLWWSYCYQYIYTANDAIGQLTISKGVTDSVKRQLIGEAKFVRAFLYFNLVNFYGDVPLALTTDYKVNMELQRAPAVDVYKQIISDLTDAHELLSSKYPGFNIISTSSDHVRPTRMAAAALLARAYLYTKDYAHAEASASEVIANPVYGLAALDSVFLKNSREAIWQLSGLQSGYNDMDAYTFILTAAPDAYYHPFTLGDDLAGAFETGDLRGSKWVGSFSGYKFPYKYKSGTYPAPSITEYIMMLRLGEQYLIRGEARIQQDHIAEGVADLNALRARARGANPGDLPDLSVSMTKEDALAAVEHERRVELFTEWGHRWLDLKRTGRIDAVMNTAAAAKNTTWDPRHALFPIPPSEILTAPGLAGHQNPGY